MFCYRDMTFCVYWRDCRDSDICGRALTEEVEASAEKWWNPGGKEELKGRAPFCLYHHEPKCFNEK